MIELANKVNELCEAVSDAVFIEFSQITFHLPRCLCLSFSFKKEAKD